MSYMELVVGTVQQQSPRPNDSESVWQMVIRDMEGREKFGVEKYGTPLQVGNGRDPLIDAYQEALDLCVYLRQEIENRRNEDLRKSPGGFGLTEVDQQP